MLRPAALLVATLLLTGCVPGDPVITPAPEPSGTPIFSSDKEALAAATDAYAKYLEAVDESLTTYNVDLLSLHSEAVALESSVFKANTYEADGKHQVGKTIVKSSAPTDLEALWHPADGIAVVQIYGCVDISNVDILDRDGTSLVASNRPDSVLYLVTLVWRAEGSEFLVSDQEHWKNDC